jgi:hypothetical protein
MFRTALDDAVVAVGISPGDLTYPPSELSFDHQFKLIWNAERTAYPKTDAAIRYIDHGGPAAAQILNGASLRASTYPRT